MGLSSCLILLGGGLIYSYTGLTNFEAIYSLISIINTNKIIQGLNLGFILIIFGLLFKIAAAPLLGVLYNKILLYARSLLQHKSVITAKFSVLSNNLQGIFSYLYFIYNKNKI